MVRTKTGGRGGGGGGGGAAYKKGNFKKRAASDDEDSAPRASKKAKDEEEDESPTPFVPEIKTNEDGDKFVGLNANGKRRLTVREFKKSILIDIREYWEDDGGNIKPGKKGISLNLDQYNTLVAALPLIEAALAEKNAQATRPDYDAAPAVASTSKDANTPSAGDEGEDTTVAKVDEEEADEEE